MNEDLLRGCHEVKTVICTFASFITIANWM